MQPIFGLACGVSVHSVGWPIINFSRISLSAKTEFNLFCLNTILEPLHQAHRRWQRQRQQHVADCDCKRDIQCRVVYDQILFWHLIVLNFWPNQISIIHRHRIIGYSAKTGIFCRNRLIWANIWQKMAESAY